LAKASQSAGQVRVPVRRTGAGNGGAKSEDQDWVAVEEPLEIRLRHGPPDARQTTTLTVTMRTPGDDAGLAAGLLLTEGIVTGAGDILGLDQSGEEPNLLVAELRPGLAVDLDGLTRHLYTGSACGVCGKTSVAAVASRSAVTVGQGFRVTATALAGLPAALLPHQSVFHGTGGLHAAALFDAAGRIHAVREDVGRHNAVDKLVGGALMEGRFPLHRRGLLVSGRASFEILQKARMAGCPLVIAVGAPSSLAIQLAWDAGMTLAGFLRDGRFNVYAGPDRISDWPAAS
jgi:FdhD protein